MEKGEIINYTFRTIGVAEIKRHQRGREGMMNESQFSLVVFFVSLS